MSLGCVVYKGKIIERFGRYLRALAVVFVGYTKSSFVLNRVRLITAHK